MTATDRIPMDVHVVAFDEKCHYNIDPKHAPYIEAIWEVYCYDKNRHVHLCEFTPSNELYYLYTSVIFTKEGDEKLTDEQKDEIYRAYEYDNGNDPVTYTHVYDVDRQESEHPGMHHHYGDPGIKEDDIDVSGCETETEKEQKRYEQVMEAICEYLNGNHVL